MRNKILKRYCVVASVVLIDFFLFMMGWIANDIFINKDKAEDNPIEQEMEEIGTTVSLEEKSSDDAEKRMIEVNVLGKEKLLIEEDRLRNSSIGFKLDNSWEREEIDAILGTIQGKWKVSKYIGYVSQGICFPDLFEYVETLEEEKRNSLYNEYDNLVAEATEKIPNISFSIKQEKTYESENYICLQDGYNSPFSVILSIDRTEDNYPVLIEQTTISPDFYVEYPVIYIRFFTREYVEEEWKYAPATLVLSSDGQFLILINGAFYSLVEVKE